jgi:ABC-type Na+ efflux pump permease subunit
MKTKKRLFIGLLGSSLILIIILTVLLWFLAVNRNTPIYRVLLVVFSLFFLTIIFLVSFGIVGMVLTLYKAKAIPSLQSYMRMATNLLFPTKCLVFRI